MLRHVSMVGLLSLVTLWLVWGSTYLAIRMAVRVGSGFPPFLMTSSRAFLGGLLLLLIAGLMRLRLRPTRAEWPLLLCSAVFLWNGGNGLVTWAEQYAHSGYAALCVGSTPIFSAIVEALIDRRRPTGLLILSLLTGFVGLALLTAPVLTTGVRADWFATVALVAAPAVWSLGSSIQQRRPIGLHPVASSGWQQVLAMVGFGMLIAATGELAPSPTPEAWMAWGYLVVAGSVLGFTAYVTALRHLPMPVVMTYAYVNPLIALVLGALILGESITGWTVAGAALILLGVAGVFRDKFGGRRVT